MVKPHKRKSKIYKKQNKLHKIPHFLFLYHRNVKILKAIGVRL